MPRGEERVHPQRGCIWDTWLKERRGHTVSAARTSWPGGGASQPGLGVNIQPDYLVSSRVD